MKLSVVDRRWIGKRVIVAASGPSLSKEMATLCNGELVIAVNDAYKLFPNADVLYACDLSWWEINKFVPDFSGERWTSHSISPKNSKQNLSNSELFHIISGRNAPGFSRDQSVIHYGNNSGFQAVNLAILFGAEEIILIGFDMRPVDGKNHFFGEHKSPLRGNHSFNMWIHHFNEAAKTVPKNIRIVNSTPNSALKCFPMIPLVNVLNPVFEAAE